MSQGKWAAFPLSKLLPSSASSFHGSSSFNDHSQRSASSTQMRSIGTPQQYHDSKKRKLNFESNNERNVTKQSNNNMAETKGTDAAYNRYMLEQRQAILENQNRLLERLVAMSQDHSFANRQIITELKNLNRSVLTMDERRYSEILDKHHAQNQNNAPSNRFENGSVYAEVETKSIHADRHEKHERQRGDRLNSIVGSNQCNSNHLVRENKITKTNIVQHRSDDDAEEESLSLIVDDDEGEDERPSGVKLAKQNAKSRIEIWNDPEPIKDGIEIWKNAKSENNLNPLVEDKQQCMEKRKPGPKKDDIVVFHDKSNWILGRLHKYFRASETWTVLDIADSQSAFSCSESNIISIPSPSQLNEHIVGLAPKTRNAKRVMALYPKATVFYPGSIKAIPKADGEYYNCCEVIFDGDENNVQNVHPRYVFPLHRFRK